MRIKTKKKTKETFKRGDRTLLILLAVLLLFGTFMIYNATVVFAQGTFGEAYRLVFLHIGWMALGLVGFSFFYNFDYHNLRRIVYPIIIIALIPMLFLAFFGFLHQVGIIECTNTFIFSPCINGANRWFYLNPPPLPALPVVGVLGFQPAEFAKFALVIFLAVMLDKNIGANIGKRYAAFIITFLVSGFLAFLILLQPNLSTAALVFAIGLSMYFASGASLTPLFTVGPLVALMGGMFIVTSSYRRARLMTFLGEGGNELSMGYHIKQILIALGSGGVFGLGFGQSRQKFQYLPEVAADSIFAIIGEELGFLGTTAVIVLFALFLYRGIVIAKSSPDLLGRLLAVGITTWLAFQFFINVSAMIRLIPLTGVPLPLISYGGSSMIFTLMGIGVLANVSRQFKE